MYLLLFKRCTKPKFKLVLSSGSDFKRFLHTYLVAPVVIFFISYQFKSGFANFLAWSAIITSELFGVINLVLARVVHLVLCNQPAFD